MPSSIDKLSKAPTAVFVWESCERFSSRVIALRINWRASSGKASGVRFWELVFGLALIHTMRRTRFFRPLSAENKMDSCGLLSSFLLFVCRSLCALKPIGKERTSRTPCCPSSLSVLIGFQYLPPQAV